MSVTIPILSNSSVSAHYDTESHVLFVTYRGILDSTTSGSLYAWVDQMREAIGNQPINGIVYDLRKVIRFKRENLYNAGKQSEQLGEQLGSQRHPIVLIAGNYYQEQMANVMILVMPDAEACQIVHTMDEALDHIQSWYASTS